MSDGFTDDLLNQGYTKGYKQGGADREKEIIDIISELKTYSVNGYDFPIPTDYIIRQIKEQNA